jgi:hypothetical protein
VQGEPGKLLNLTAVPAPNEAAAAQYYPDLLVFDARNPGRFAVRRPQLHSEGALAERLAQQVKNIGCIGCHQLGQASTPTIPEAFKSASSEEAWMRRLRAPHPASAGPARPLGC